MKPSRKNSHTEKTVRKFSCYKGYIEATRYKRLKALQMEKIDEMPGDNVIKRHGTFFLTWRFCDTPIYHEWKKIQVGHHI